MILHPPKDDDAVSGRFDLVAVELETAADAERGDLALDQPLARLRQRPLRLTNANRERAALGLAGLDQKLAKKMRFSGTPAAKGCAVPAGPKQRLKYFRRGDRQG